MKVLVGTLLLPLCVGCASSAPLERRDPLPFHVALMPLTPQDVRTDSAGSAEGRSTEMQLDPNPELLAALSARLASALEERAFARVTLLDSLSIEAGGPNAAGLRDATAILAARQAGADLLVRVELAVQPVIRQEKNGTFWLNMPLFLIGGPFCWWLPDRTYSAEAEASAWFYDLRTLGSGSSSAPLQAGQVSVASASRRTERMDLSFSERAQGDVGDYLLSVIWPCGFLAVESEELQRSLTDQLVDQLGRGLAGSALDQSPALTRGATPFFLDIAKSELVRDASGELIFRGTAYLTRTREVESLGTWSVSLGNDTVLARSFDAQTPQRVEGSYLRYDFEGRLGETGQSEWVQLEIEAGERSRLARTYTFRVPAEPAR